MSEFIPRRVSPSMKHAHDIAKRASELFDHGGRFNPAPTNSDLWIPETYFAIDPTDYSASTAQVVVRRPSERDTLRGGVHPYSADKVAKIEMGHYDPAISGWRIYDDLINAEEKAHLEEVFSQMGDVEQELLLIEAGSIPGNAVYDYRHEATEEIRSQLHSLLVESGALTGLITAHPQRVFRRGFVFDEHSSAYVGMITKEFGQEARDTLMVYYHGLASGFADVAERQKLGIPIATRDASSGGEWHPNRPLLTKVQWEGQLETAVDMLMEHKKLFSKFSLARCAMVSLIES